MKYRLDSSSLDLSSSLYDFIINLERPRRYSGSISKNLVASGVHRKSVFAKVYCSAFIKRITLTEADVFIARLNFPFLKFKRLIR